MKRSVHRAATSPAAPPRIGQEARLGQQLRHELPPRRAEREPHRHLGRPGSGARQQQVSDVGARDQEHDARDAEKEQQGYAGRASCITLWPRRPSTDRQGLRNEPRQGLVAHVRLERRLHVGQDAPVQGRERGARLLDGNLRLRGGRTGRASSSRRSSKRPSPVPRPSRACIVSGTNTMDGMWRAVPRKPAGATPTMVNGSPLTSSTSPSTSRAPPSRDCQNSWLRTATGCPPIWLVDLRTEQPPERRHEAQRREVRAGDLHALDDVEGAPLAGRCWPRSQVAPRCP